MSGRNLLKTDATNSHGCERKCDPEATMVRWMDEKFVHVHWPQIFMSNNYDGSYVLEQRCQRKSEEINLELYKELLLLTNIDPKKGNNVLECNQCVKMFIL